MRVCAKRAAGIRVACPFGTQRSALKGDRYISHQESANQILDDFVAAVSPFWAASRRDPCTISIGCMRDEGYLPLAVEHPTRSRDNFYSFRFRLW